MHRRARPASPALDQPFELYDLDEDVSKAGEVAAAHPEVVARFEEFLEGARTESSLWPLEE